MLKQFYQLLKIKNENDQVSERGSCDEQHEKEKNSQNLAYTLTDDGLSFTPNEELSGRKLKHTRLMDTKIYCFDYGPEVYVWIGKNADKVSRKNAMVAGRKIWEGKQRPAWGVYQRVAGGLETSLFREKFKDWPDVNSRNVLTVKNPCTARKDNLTFIVLDPISGADLRKPLPEAPPGLVLEMTDVGRGDGLLTDLSQDIFGHDVETTGVEVWRITDNSYEEYPKEMYGEFFTGESFIIRWAYRVMMGGKKMDHDTGRDRTAYFFWQGEDCSIKEKGKSAFLTVRVDTERAPQIQLTQSHETPAFLQIFKGSIVIYKGKMGDKKPHSETTRLFQFRGEVEKEGSLIQMPDINCSCLRSRASYVLQHGDEKFYVWHGSKSRAHTVAGSFAAANKLAPRTESKPTIVEVQEGKEGDEFWKIFPEGRKSYFSLLTDERMYAKSIRLFNFYEEKKEFAYRELGYNCRAPKLASPYPFLQSDLYSAEQPALFILDSLSTVYVWVGWWPAHNTDGEALSHTGSAKTDFIERYKLTLHTAVSYADEETKEKPEMVVVRAGAEPTQFRALFPWWREEPDLPAPDGPSPTPVTQELKKFLRTEYTLLELQQRPPPLGVDPLRLEQYLSVNEFTAIFNMTKSDFLLLQPWKQRKEKIKYKLF